jgi:phosphatidylethanolamine-binding protein (PEBP) family uncharacterized protein
LTGATRRGARSVRTGLLVPALTLTLAGCAGSGSDSTTTHHVAKLGFKSPTIAGPSLPVRYTCDGGDTSPPLEWGAMPPGTRELALLVIGLRPAGASNGYSVSIEWAVAGLNPALHRIEAGTLPAGAHLGTTSAGGTRYSVCPPKGVRELYQFTLYTVPPTVTIPQEFTGLSLLAEIGAETAADAAKARGSFDVEYQRR